MPVSAAHWFKSCFSLQTPKEPTTSSPSTSGNPLRKEDQPSKPRVPQQNNGLDRFQRNHLTAASTSEEKSSSAQREPENEPTSETSGRSLADMPEDLLLKISASMQSNVALIDYLNLSSLKAANLVFRKAIDSHDYYKTIKSTLKEQSSLFSPPFIQQLFSNLATLSQEQRQQLINFTKDLKSTKLKAEIQRNFAMNLSLLNEVEKKQLIDHIVNQEENIWKIQAFRDFIAKLHLLNSEQKNQLINATTSIQDAHLSRTALRGFTKGENLNLVNDRQKDQLINAVVRHSEVYPKLLAINDFVKKLHLLNNTQIEQLIDSTIRLKESIWKYALIQTFLEKPDHLSPTQLEKLNQAKNGNYDDIEVTGNPR